MQHRWTFLAACLFALAIAMVAFRHDNPPSAGPASGVPLRRDANPDATAKVPANPIHSTAQAAPTRDSHRNDQPGLDGPDRSLTRSAAAGTSHNSLSRSELETRAQAVDRDANHELARLIPLLDLTPDQQQRVFQALARTSPNFVPGMLVDGTALKPSAAAPQQTVLAELSAAQVAAYLQDSNERSAWWSEYIGGVASELQTGTPALGGSTASVATAPAADATPPVTTTPALKQAHAVTGGE